MEGPAGAVRPLAYCSQPVLPVEEARTVEAALAAVQEQAAVAGQIRWKVHYVDGSNVRAHQHPAEAKRERETKP